MKDSTTVTKDFYVSIDDLVVTAIQTIGEYDHITRRECPSEEAALALYHSLGGIVHGTAD